jgi:hypothetical protein
VKEQKVSRKIAKRVGHMVAGALIGHRQHLSPSEKRIYRRLKKLEIRLKIVLEDEDED